MYPQLKEYFLKIPKLHDVPHPSPVWRVYGQQHQGSRWGKKEFREYKDAFGFWKSRYKRYHDLSITCRVQQFDPPMKIVKIKRHGQPVMVRVGKKLIQETREVYLTGPTDHYWCKYCRRFTVFGWFNSHHAFRDLAEKYHIQFDPTVERCTVCGIRKETGAFVR